jgi:hypothetical protein
MSPSFSFRKRTRPRRLVTAVILCLLAGTLAACSGAAAPSFNPTGPCTADGKAAGAYPELEALVPRTFGGAAPATLDSGRNCTAKSLGTLANHGLHEVRFAGGVWPGGSNSGITIAVFRAAGLQSEWIAEWYEATARAGRTTGNIQLTKPTIGGRPGQRLDLVNGESKQTVISWPSASADTVNVVLAADEPEDQVQAAVSALS